MFLKVYNVCPKSTTYNCLGTFPTGSKVVKQEMVAVRETLPHHTGEPQMTSNWVVQWHILQAEKQLCAFNASYDKAHDFKFSNVNQVSADFTTLGIEQSLGRSLEDLHSQRWVVKYTHVCSSLNQTPPVPRMMEGSQIHVTRVVFTIVMWKTANGNHVCGCCTF